MNVNTIAAAPQAAATGNILAESAFCIAPANTVRTVVALPSTIGNNAIEGREMVLRASILITGGTTTNYTPSIRFQSGGQTDLTTFTNDVAIIVPTAFAVNSVTRLWACTAKLWWDSSSARLNGNFSASIDTTYTAAATLTAGLSANVANASAIKFFICGFFSATNANNTAVLKQLEIDLL